MSLPAPIVAAALPMLASRANTTDNAPRPALSPSSHAPRHRQSRHVVMVAAVLTQVRRRLGTPRKHRPPTHKQECAMLDATRKHRHLRQSISHVYFSSACSSSQSNRADNLVFERNGLPLGEPSAAIADLTHVIAPPAVQPAGHIQCAAVIRTKDNLTPR